MSLAAIVQAGRSTRLERALSLTALELRLPRSRVTVPDPHPTRHNTRGRGPRVRTAMAAVRRGREPQRRG